MSARLVKLAAAFGSIIALAFAAAVLSFAAANSRAAGPPTASQTPTQTQTQQGDQSSADSSAMTGDNPSESATSESDGDSAAQATVCQKAGINPNADNVQYDDQTGVCAIDTGSGSQQ